MAIFIRLRQNKMREGNGYNKWYARMVNMGEVGTNELARIIERNTTFKQGEIKGLITELVAEMKEQLAEGKTVMLDDFGRFSLTVESEGAETREKFDLRRNIKSIKCRFRAAGRRDPYKHTITEVFAEGVDVKKDE
jgi:predicted histone-like DNA-binding protein